MIERLMAISQSEYFSLYMCAAIGWFLATFFIIQFVKIFRELRNINNSEDGVLDSFKVAIEDKRKIVIIYNGANRAEEKRMRKIYSAVLCQKMWLSELKQADSEHARFCDGTVIDIKACGDLLDGDFYLVAENSVALNYLDKTADIWTI